MNNNTHDDHIEEEQTFMIPDEQGVEHEMVLVYTFESDEQMYAVLLEKDNLEADGVIFRIEEDNDEVFLVSIQDDSEWERVVSVYNQEISEQETE